MNKISSADLKLFRALFDSAYIALSDLKLRVFIRCDAQVAKLNPILAGAVHKSPAGSGLQDFVNLNVSQSAIRDFIYGSDSLSFNTRFSGTAHTIVVPFSLITAMYSPDVATSSLHFNLDLAMEKTPESTNTGAIKPKAKLSVIK